MAEEKKQDLGKTQPGLNEEKDKANQDIGTGRSSGSSDMPEKGSSQGAE